MSRLHAVWLPSQQGSALHRIAKISQHKGTALDILLLDSLAPDAKAWLLDRYRVWDMSDAAELNADQLADRWGKARAAVLPSDFKVTQAVLAAAPSMEVIGRLRGGTSNTDLTACQASGVRVLNTARANVHSTVEFMLASLMLLQRPSLWHGLNAVKVVDSDAAHAEHEQAKFAPGREMYRSVVGIVGLGPVAMAMAPALHALGVRMVGYDPAIHSSSPIWSKLNIYPLPLAGVLSTADAIGVHMIYASRFHHFVNGHALKHVKRGQVWVCTSRSMLFEPDAVSKALQDGRIKAMLLDSFETEMAGLPPDLLALPNFFLTPRLGSHTVQAHDKASWYLAHRMDAILTEGSAFADRPDSLPTMPIGIESQENETDIAAEERQVQQLLGDSRPLI